MKNYFKKIVEELNIEIHCLGDSKMYGLQWGQGRVAEILGFKRKDVIRALDWADSHNEEAEKVIAEICKI